jgi:hypothetical protein
VTGPSGEALVRDLVERFALLGPDLAEHLEDNFGEILPHLFLADVMRRLVDLCRGDTAACDRARPPIDYLEERFRAGDDQIKELISTGFVEALPREGEPGFEIRSLLGPELSAEARRVA